jgi:hypothetical protein
MSDNQTKNNNEDKQNSQGQAAKSQSKPVNNLSSEASGISENLSGQLDQFVSYMKENWKPILTELVAAGVTAYLTHDAKSKMSKRSN